MKIQMTLLGEKLGATWAQFGSYCSTSQSSVQRYLQVMSNPRTPQVMFSVARSTTFGSVSASLEIQPLRSSSGNIDEISLPAIQSSYKM